MIFSIDLRERVIAAISNGMPIKDILKIFCVSRRVIYEWLDLQKRTGSLAPITGYQHGHSHIIKDWDQFKKFAEENRLSTCEQMAIKWQSLHNVKISKYTIRNGLIKIGYSFKKNVSLCRSK